MEDSLFLKMEEDAQKNPVKIAFPEANNEMILRAAAEVVKRKIGYPYLIGNQGEISLFAKELGISIEGFSFLDHQDDSAKEKLAENYLSRFDDFSEKAIKRKAKNPVNFAMFLLKLDIVDAVAAGREYTTADVIISAQSIVGLKEGVQNISSLGILNIPNYNGSEGSMLAIADCAVIPSPDSEALADIAISSADTVKTLLNWEPRIAMLSFSTDGSSEHESIDIIKKSIEIVKSRQPDLKIDGDFQLDTAINQKVAAKKLNRESDTAGKANILIFPNLHAGNIGVKIFQNFAKADAYGPVLQGFAKPICDFSRSAPLSEMMGNIIMLIIRAQSVNNTIS